MIFYILNDKKLVQIYIFLRIRQSFRNIEDFQQVPKYFQVQRIPSIWLNIRFYLNNNFQAPDWLIFTSRDTGFW